MTETIFKEFYSKKKISYGNIYVILFIVFCAILRKIIYKNKKTEEKQNTKILSSSSCEYFISKLNLKNLKFLIPLLNELHWGAHGFQSVLDYMNTF